MKQLINIDDDMTIVADKVNAFFIDPHNKKCIIIWLDGGQVVKSSFNSEESCLHNLNLLKDILVNGSAKN